MLLLLLRGWWLRRRDSVSLLWIDRFGKCSFCILSSSLVVVFLGLRIEIVLLVSEALFLSDLILSTYFPIRIRAISMIPISTRSMFSKPSSITNDSWLELTQDSYCKMINAILVFNNNGQPRLTKFYTQLVSNRHLQTSKTANVYQKDLLLTPE